MSALNCDDGLSLNAMYEALALCVGMATRRADKRIIKSDFIERYDTFHCCGMQSHNFLLTFKC